MEHVTALVDHDATTQSPGIEVQFLNLVSRSPEVRRRVFATEAEVLAWLGENRQHVELVLMAPVGGHTHFGCSACMDDDDPGDDGSSIEPYDVDRDDRLTDEAA
jgi:hypothetical protein